MSIRSLALAAAVLSVSAMRSAPVAAQVLSDELLARLREGSQRLELRDPPVSVPLVGSPTLPLVAVRLNGRGPFRFLVDLGSNVVILRRAVADSARATVLLDRARSDIVRLDSLELGRARFHHVIAGAYDSLDVDGVLGYNLLRSCSFTLDYPRQRLILHRSPLPEPDYVSVFPYEVVDRLPYVTVRFGRDSLRVNLDTGANEYLTVPPAVQARLPWASRLEPGPRVTNEQTGSTHVMRGRLRAALMLGPATIPVSEVYVNPDAETCWLGSAAMRQAAWSFDPANRRVRVTWNEVR